MALQPTRPPFEGACRSRFVDPVRAPADFLVYGRPDLRDAEIEEVVATLKSGWIGTGPRVARFEQDFANYTGAEHAVAVGSCTAALHLSIIAAGIGPGDEVITTPLTFAATANAILHAGARPVLADVGADMNISVDKVASAITGKTKAILPVHFAGRPCDMDGLGQLAEDHELTLIEDCAHAIETTWRGQHAGTFGAFGCFSFYATKNVTCGEGGMVLAQDGHAADRIKRLALHGLSRDAWKRFGDEGYQHYFVEEAGYKYNLTDLQAALGIHQLARVEANLDRRKQLWTAYDAALADLPVECPTAEEGLPANSRHARHLYPILVEAGRADESPRDTLLAGMTRQGIGVGVHYLALTEHPFYRQHLGWTPEDAPVATDVGRRCLSLPLSPAVSDQDQADVLEALRRCLVE